MRFRGAVALAAVAATVAAAGCSGAGDEGGWVDGGADAAGVTQRVDTGPLDAEVGAITVRTVYGDSDGWLVTGWAAEPRQRPAAILLTSPDGLDWAPDELPAPDAQAYRAGSVARAGDQLVILGTAQFGRDTSPVAWIGGPGDWTLAVLGDSLGSYRDAGIGKAISAGDTAIFTASVRDDDGRWEPRIWLVDADGGATEAAGLDGIEGSLAAIGSDGERLLAGGLLGPAGAFRPPAMFESTDGGRSWQSVEFDGLDRATVRGLNHFNGAWWLAGAVEGGASGRQALWRSTDGRSWQLLNEPEQHASSRGELVLPLGNDTPMIGTTGVLVPTPGQNYWRWPGAGEAGSFSSAAVYDGRLVAAGTPRDGLTELYVTSNALEASWRRIRVAEHLLAETNGVHHRNLDSLAASSDTLVVAGDQVPVAGLRDSFLAAGPDWRRAEGAASFKGSVTSVAYLPEIGFFAAGHESASDVRWHGARILHSADGQEWERLIRTSGVDDRAHLVLDFGDGDLIVAGMTWTDGRVEPMMWRWRDGELAEYEAEGLAGNVSGGGNGCSGTGVAAMEVFDGDATRKLAVSTDGGASFTVYDDGPLTDAAALPCAVGPDGEITVLVNGLSQPELHVLDPAAGSWREITVPEGDRLELDRIRHLPEVGWVLVGSEEIADLAPFVAVSPDLASWRTLTVPTEAERSWVSDAALLGEELHLLGREEGQPAMWSIPIAETTDAGR